ncbi:MAG: hypothetical protein N2C14_29525 [Planctomycetales bacterium]
MCGHEMCTDELRYVVSMDVCVAQDPLECSCDDDDVDHLEELTEIIEELEATGEDYDDDAHAMRFDLCPECRKKFIKSPLGREALAKQFQFSKN